MDFDKILKMIENSDSPVIMTVLLSFVCGAYMFIKFILPFITKSMNKTSDLQKEFVNLQLGVNKQISDLSNKFEQHEISNENKLAKMKIKIKNRFIMLEKDVEELIRTCEKLEKQQHLSESALNTVKLYNENVQRHLDELSEEVVMQYNKVDDKFDTIKDSVLTNSHTICVLKHEAAVSAGGITEITSALVGIKNFLNE